MSRSVLRVAWISAHGSLARGGDLLRDRHSSAGSGCTRAETERDRSGAAELPLDLKRLLRCRDLCELGPSQADETFGWELRQKARGGAGAERQASAYAEKACLFRCKRGQKDASEESAVPPLAEYVELPARLREYHDAVAACRGAELHEADGAIASLQQCGVVHIDEGPVGVELLAAVRDAYDALRADEGDMELRLDKSQLRAGRHELWVPFAWPFNAPELLRPPQLMPVISEYLGPNFTFDHMTVLVSPTGAGARPQRVHADVQKVRTHLEVHLPIADLTQEMGPTLFCPGSHGVAEVDDVMRAYFSYANCSFDASLSYALPLRMGQVTIYDGNVFHAGTANVADVDRPVLQLSWAADEESVRLRKYAERTFGQNATRLHLMDADIGAFRNAARG